MEESKQGVVLETFSHQVGGKSLILSYDHNTVAKLLKPNERRFYLELPDSLRPFVPRFKGILKVDVKVGNGGEIKLISSTTPKTNDGDGDIKHEEKMSSAEGKVDHHADNETESINPWILQCRNVLYKTLQDYRKQNKPIEFVLMEDLVYEYTRPCVMDIKMGNIMHLGYTDKKKYESQKAKVDSSTSKTLGLRMAGLEIYNQASQKYLYRNKEYGLQLNDEGFREEILDFVCSGTKHLRKDVVICFIKKLQNLCTCLENENNVRFFTSSLLLIYEGQPISSKRERETNIFLSGYQSTSQTAGQPSCCGSGNCKNNINREIADVKIIDFARSICYATSKSVGPDDSFLLGLRNLIKMLNGFLMESAK